MGAGTGLGLGAGGGGGSPTTAASAWACVIGAGLAVELAGGGAVYGTVTVAPECFWRWKARLKAVEAIRREATLVMRRVASAVTFPWASVVLLSSLTYCNQS